MVPWLLGSVCCICFAAGWIGGALRPEFYLYRRVAAATRWFGGHDDYDVFAKAKAAGLRSAAPSLEALAERLGPVMADGDTSALFLSIALWGNRMDLSLWPADAGVASSADAFNQVLADSNAQLLADDTPAVVALLDELRSGGGATIDLVVDNAGFELCTDLLLADHLLSSRAATCVRLRVKHHPTFVSDALAKDVAAHADELAANGGGGGSEWDAAALARRWREHLEAGRIVCVADPYWAMPYPMWQMPSDLFDELQSTSALVIMKVTRRRMIDKDDRPHLDLHEKQREEREIASCTPPRAPVYSPGGVRSSDDAINVMTNVLPPQGRRELPARARRLPVAV